MSYEENTSFYSFDNHDFEILRGGFYLDRYNDTHVIMKENISLFFWKYEEIISTEVNITAFQDPSAPLERWFNISGGIIMNPEDMTRAVKLLDNGTEIYMDNPFYIPAFTLYHHFVGDYIVWNGHNYTMIEKGDDYYKLKKLPGNFTEISNHTYNIYVYFHRNGRVWCYEIERNFSDWWGNRPCYYEYWNTTCQTAFIKWDRLQFWLGWHKYRDMHVFEPLPPIPVYHTPLWYEILDLMFRWAIVTAPPVIAVYLVIRHRRKGKK